MGGEKIGEPFTGKGICQEQVTHLAGVGIADPGAGLITANLFQGPGDAIRVAGELHRAGIGQVFTLPANGRLDQAAA